MTRRTIEILSGEGEIYAADRLLRRTTYRLTILEGDAPGSHRIEGTIEIATEGEGIILTRVEKLTLLMDDGRQLSFSLVSPNGRIQALGGLEGTETSPR